MSDHGTYKYGQYWRNFMTYTKSFAFAFHRHFITSYPRWAGLKVMYHVLILPWSVSCSNCIMLGYSDPDPHDGRISVLDSINGGVSYPRTINSRNWRPPAGVPGQASSQRALSTEIPVPQFAINHIPVSGRSAPKQAECVNFSTNVLNVIAGLNGKISSINNYNKLTNKTLLEIWADKPPHSTWLLAVFPLSQLSKNRGCINLIWGSFVKAYFSGFIIILWFCKRQKGTEIWINMKNN